MDFSTTYPTDTFDTLDTVDTYETYDGYDTYEDVVVTDTEPAGSCCCDTPDTTTGGLEQPWELPPEPDYLPTPGAFDAPPAPPTGDAPDPSGVTPPPPPPPSGDPIGNPAGYPLSPEQQALVVDGTTTGTVLPPALPETQSVIPAGQPGGPAALETPYPSSGFVGGQLPTEITIIDPASQSVYEPPASMVIGPPTNPDSTVSNLMDVYGIAVSQGDVMSQILIDRTLQSMHNATAIWTI